MDKYNKAKILAQKIKTARQEALCKKGYCNLDSLYAVNCKLREELQEEMSLIEWAKDIFTNPDAYL
jgi:hypothetical protein